MNSQPYFSVIVPTKDRPPLLPAAIKSVLQQIFADYELIVSDNSCDKECLQANEAVVRAYCEDDRVRYVRPDHYMNMADHWEFATRHACGTYVAILTDRFVMRPSALEVLHSRIAECPVDMPDAVVWNVQSGFSDRSKISTTAPFSGKSKTHNSQDVLNQYAQLSAWGGESMYVNTLPRGLNSLYRRTLADQIRAKHGRLFYPLCPDYTSAFLLLAYSSTILEVDLPLYMSHGNLSNGQKCATYGIGSYANEYERNPFWGCALSLDIVFNSIVGDYKYIKSRTDDKLPEIEIVGYFLSLYRELLLKEQWGSPMDLGKMYSQWHEAVEQLPEQQRQRINEGLGILNGLRSRFVTARKFALKFGIDRYYHRVMETLRRVRHVKNGGCLYANVLEAAQATDDYIHDENGKVKIY